MTIQYIIYKRDSSYKVSFDFGETRFSGTVKDSTFAWEGIKSFGGKIICSGKLKDEENDKMEKIVELITESNKTKILTQKNLKLD